jgi:hypothetical protein
MPSMAWVRFPPNTTNRRQATVEALQLAYHTMQVRRQTEKPSTKTPSMPLVRPNGNSTMPYSP